MRRVPAGGSGKPRNAASIMAGSTASLSLVVPPWLARVSNTSCCVATSRITMVKSCLTAGDAPRPSGNDKPTPTPPPPPPPSAPPPTLGYPHAAGAPDLKWRGDLSFVDAPTNGQTKKCNRCGEEILAIATRCKHCGADYKRQEAAKTATGCAGCLAGLVALHFLIPIIIGFLIVIIVIIAKLLSH